MTDQTLRNPKPNAAKEIWRARWVRTIFCAAFSIVPGLAFVFAACATARMAALYLGAPFMLVSLLTGLSLGFAHKTSFLKPGISLAAKPLLRAGVALLGVQISLSTIFALGGSTIILLISAIGVTVAAAAGFARLMKEDKAFGLLIGGATGICGASAALAISAVLPSSPDRDRQTSFTILAVTLMSTLAMILYPMIFSALGFSNSDAGILIGGTIHDVAQVVGAGYSVSQEAGDIAVVVKLFRVLMLLPVVFGLSILFSGRITSGPAQTGGLRVPGFVLAFALLATVNSTGFLDEQIVAFAGTSSQWLLAASVLAIGTQTPLSQIVKGGRGPTIITAGASIALLIFSIGVMKFLL